jgi:hypothetical protein
MVTITAQECNGNNDEVIGPSGLGDFSILHEKGKASKIIALFDDYAHRGPDLTNMCLYDYCSLAYKIPISKTHDVGGLPFNLLHPQHKSYRQFVRKKSSVIPTLLRRLLFLLPDSGGEPIRNDYFCLYFSRTLFALESRYPSSEIIRGLVGIAFPCPGVQYPPPRVLRYIDKLTCRLMGSSERDAIN